jgi:hypothetical protein
VPLIVWRASSLALVGSRTPHGDALVRAPHQREVNLDQTLEPAWEIIRLQHTGGQMYCEKYRYELTSLTGEGLALRQQGDTHGRLESC